MEHAQIVASTASPAFAVDLAGRIVAWNHGAEDFLGYAAAQVLGRTCWDAVQGQDPYENAYCGPHCPLIGMALHRQAIHGCELLYRRADGATVRATVDSFIVPGHSPSEMVVVHVLHPAASRAASDAVRLKSGRSDVRNPLLTERELQVLRLMGRGVTTRGISRELRISVGTVRNHTGKILRSLKAHTRLQAVAAARALNLID
jgi:PAS domain S-box-containing protein